MRLLINGKWPFCVYIYKGTPGLCIAMRLCHMRPGASDKRTMSPANLDHSCLTIRFLLCRVFMEVLSFRRLIDDPYPDRPVSKPLPRLPLLRIASQQTLHNLQDLGLHDARAVELV